MTIFGDVDSVVGKRNVRRSTKSRDADLAVYRIDESARFATDA